MSEAQVWGRPGRLGAAVALTAAGAVALLLWTAATVVHAGGGVPEEATSGAPAPPRGRRGTASSTLTGSAVTRGPLVFREQVKHLRAAQLAPTDCVLFATIPDLSRLIAKAEDLAVWKILTDPTIRSRLDSAMASMRRSARESAKPGLLGFLQMTLASDVDHAAARSLFRKEVALIGLKPKGSEGPRLAVLAAITGGRDPLNDVLDSLMGEILTQYPQFTSSEKEHRATRIRSLGTTSFQISFAYFENLFIVATGEDTIVELVKTYDEGRRKQLAGKKVFKQIEENIGKGAEAFYRLDLGGLVAGLAEAEAEADAGGTGYSALAPGVGVLWGSMRLDGEAVRERMIFVGVPAEDGSLVRSVAGAEPLISPPKTIGYFPVDTAVYYVTTLEPSETVARMRKDPRSAKRVSDLMKTLSEYLGADFEEEVLPAFGGELAIGVIIPPGMPAEILLALEVKRQDLLEKHATKAIDQFIEANSSGVHDAVYRGHKIRHAEPPAKVKQPSLIQVIFPDLSYAWPKEGEPLLIASSRRALEKAIRQQEHGRSVLTEKADYQRCVGGLRARRTALFYVDLKDSLGFLAGEVPTALGPSVMGPLAQSADMKVIVPHMFGVGGVVDTARAGMSMEFCGPLGPVTALGLSAFGRLGEERDGPPPIEEDSDRLRAIGVALHLYATDFDRFPTMLSELYAEYLSALSDFESPSGKRAVKTKDDIDTRSDYVYVTRLSPADLSGRIIAYGKEYVLGGRGRNVLYLNGRVEFVDEAEFKLLMGKQQGPQVED